MKNLLGSAWGTKKEKEYWNDHPQELISRLKLGVDKVMKEGFESSERQIGIYSLYRKLQDPLFGFMPCNLTAYVMGFLLRNYINGQYRCSDTITPSQLDIEELKKMISRAIKKENSPSIYKETYIILRTDKEKAFDKASMEIFGVAPSDTLNSQNMQNIIRGRIKDYKLPLFFLKYLSDEDYEGEKDNLFKLID